MLISKNNRKKHGFTLVEVLFVCSIFAIIVVGIIGAVNRSYRFMDNIKLQIKATNLAREGVEMMFNIRDTNWREYSGEKDKQWLFLGKNGNNNNDYFKQGIYSLVEEKTSTNCQKNCNMHIYAKKLSIASSRENEFYDNEGFWSTTQNEYNTERPKSKIPFQGTYYYYSTSDGQNGQIEEGSINELLGSETDFYRIVRVYGIYCKNSSDSNETASCSSDSSAPKEMRFCVKVFYKNNGDPHSTELCSIMTNFEE